MGSFNTGRFLFLLATARIDSTMKTSIHLSVNEKLELDCTSSGNPPPKVTWRRIDGPKLNEDRTIQHNKGLLSVHNVGQADRGKYQCIASNSLGNDSRTFLVDVRGINITGWYVLDKFRNLNLLFVTFITLCSP